MSLRVLSEFYSDDMTRKAKVFVTVGAPDYYVQCTDEFGTSFTSMFDNNNDAEDYADDWVLKTNGD